MNKYLLTEDKVKAIDKQTDKNLRDLQMSTEGNFTDDDVEGIVLEGRRKTFEAQDRKSRRLMLEDIKKACINPNHKAFRCPKYACCECMDELKEELK